MDKIGNQIRLNRLELNTLVIVRLGPYANNYCVARKNALEWDDTTLKDAGKVGVWTRADSVTVFDDFSYGSGKAPPG